MDPYVKTTWSNGTTPLNAGNLNKIEDGIYDCTNEVLSIENNTLPELASDITELSSAIENLESSIHSYLPLSAGSNHALTGDLYLSAIKDHSGEKSISLDDEANGIYFELKNHAFYSFDEDDTTGGTIATKEYIEERIDSIHLYKHTINCAGLCVLYIINTSQDLLDESSKIYNATNIISCYASYGDDITSTKSYNVKITRASVRPYTYAISCDDVSLIPQSDTVTTIF